jgi:hypothetical protein
LRPLYEWALSHPTPVVVVVVVVVVSTIIIIIIITQHNKFRIFFHNMRQIHVRWVLCHHGMTRPQVADVRWVPCHQGMARPQVAGGGDAFQVWRVVANILNKQSRTADKRWSSSLGVGRGVKTPNSKK